MVETIAKILITSLLVVAVSEAAKRSVLFASIIASIPLTSVLALSWLYADTRDGEKVAALATGILWLVLPSLLLFIALPLLLRSGVPFVPAMAASIAVTAAGYFAMIALLAHLGIQI